jgi:phage shock protein A
MEIDSLFSYRSLQSAMSDDLADAVVTFLQNAESAYEEYEQGYADADATLRVLERHLDDLRSAAEEPGSE